MTLTETLPGWTWVCVSSLVSIGPAVWPAIRNIDTDRQTNKHNAFYYIDGFVFLIKFFKWWSTLSLNSLIVKEWSDTVINNNDIPGHLSNISLIILKEYCICFWWYRLSLLWFLMSGVCCSTVKQVCECFDENERPIANAVPDNVWPSTCCCYCEFLQKFIYICLVPNINIRAVELTR